MLRGFPHWVRLSTPRRLMFGSMFLGCGVISKPSLNGIPHTQHRHHHRHHQRELRPKKGTKPCPPEAENVSDARRFTLQPHPVGSVGRQGGAPAITYSHVATPQLKDAWRRQLPSTSPASRITTPMSPSWQSTSPQAQKRTFQKQMMQVMLIIVVSLHGAPTASRFGRIEMLKNAWLWMLNIRKRNITII